MKIKILCLDRKRTRHSRLNYEHTYLLLVRFVMKCTAGTELAAKVLASDGVKLAVNVLEPRTDGLQLQVAVKFGDVPVVEIFRQPGIRLPSIKNRTNPGASTPTEIVEEMPFFNSPEVESDPIVAAEAKPATAL